MHIGSRPGPGTGGPAGRCAAARKDLDNDHAAAVAGAWRAMIGGSDIRIGCILCRRWLDLRDWGDYQLLARAMLALQAALATSP